MDKDQKPLGKFKGSSQEGANRMESEGGGGTAIHSAHTCEKFSKEKSPGFENRAEEIDAMDV